MRIGVVTFPGTLDDTDTVRAIARAGAEPIPLWHGDADLRGVDAVILPGGFSYGDYLRAGAIARFAPVMEPVIAAAQRGMPVLGICNGFQILCEAGLLPGALVRNHGLVFTCHVQRLRVASTATAWTGRYPPEAEIAVPVKNGEGAYMAAEPVLDELDAEGRVVLRYLGENPNGSRRDIAGISDHTGRIVGVMPHPEHAIDPLTGPSADGLDMFASALDRVAPRREAPGRGAPGRVAPDTAAPGKGVLDREALP